MKSETIDIISSLPDDLLLKILSSLSINEVVATRILSKRWRFIWKCVTKLNFDYCSCEFSQLRSFVSKARVLQSSHLKFITPLPNPDDYIVYIDLLAHLSIREVRIETVYASIRLPRSLYSKFWSLERLILQRLSLVNVPGTQVGLRMRFLKTLHLLSVKFSDDEFVQRFLSSCPVLEDLVVRRTAYVNVTMFTINVPTLRSLSISYSRVVCRVVSPPVGAHGFVINAPSLRYLNIRDYISNVLRFGHMPELVKASVEISCDQLGNFLGSSLASSIRSLSLCAPVWWNLLNPILEDAPRLQVLKLKLKQYCVRNSTDPMDRWNQPFSVPQCLMSHLEIFEWSYYKGTKQEKKVAKYILANANCLKKATFSSVSAKKKRIFKKLEYVARESEACQLVFE